MKENYGNARVTLAGRNPRPAASIGPPTMKEMELARTHAEEGSDGCRAVVLDTGSWG